MKRSQFIDLNRMRKQPAFQLTKVAALVGGTLALSGCGFQEDATIYSSLEACKAEKPDQVQTCELAYQQAMEEAKQTAPRYRGERDCEAEFGNCVGAYDNRGNSWFMPMMAGFMLGNSFNRPVYSGVGRYSGSYYGGDGTNYGKVGSRSSTKVSVSSFREKSAPARTMSRGGFGSKVSARSSWGG